MKSTIKASALVFTFTFAAAAWATPTHQTHSATKNPTYDASSNDEMHIACRTWSRGNSCAAPELPAPPAIEQKNQTYEKSPNEMRVACRTWSRGNSCAAPEPLSPVKTV